MDLEDIIGWIGCILTTCFFIPQLSPFIKIIKGKLYFEDAPGFFISSCYANCFLWMIYGEMIFSDQIRITNMIACVICLIAMIIYLVYEFKKYLLDTILNVLILTMASWAIYKFLYIAVDDDRIVGKICISSSIIIILNFVYIIYRVIKEKNYLLIHFYYTAIYFISSLVWLFYGIITKDIYVVFPYILSIIISLIQIIIFLNYEKKYPIIEEKDINTSIGIERAGNEENENKKEETEIKIEEEVQTEEKEKPVKIVSKEEN
jgi:solute carrier family 50 protein (sugar transporter)